MSESELSTEASTSSRTSPSPDLSRSIVERCVTLGESSGCGETGDNSSRDQPRAFVHDQGNESFNENETESGGIKPRNNFKVGFFSHNLCINIHMH